LDKPISLVELNIGKIGIVKNLTTSGALRRRLLDLGFVPGATVKCERKSLFNDPTAYYIRGAVIALRKDEARTVEVTPLT